MEDKATPPADGEAIVLPEMSGWEFDWDTVSGTLQQYDDSLYWLAIVVAAIFLLGTQGIFFPLYYRVAKQQATTSMRLAYLSSLLVATIVFHWWLWNWIFFALIKNYWIWLFWCLFALLWLGLIAWTPKRRLES